MTDGICLVVPDEGWEAAAVAFRQEFWEAGEQVICGSALLDQMPDYAEWLHELERGCRAQNELLSIYESMIIYHLLSTND